MKISDYISDETVRQSGTVQEALGMYDAHGRFAFIYGQGYPLDEVELRSAAYRINGTRWYRPGPAVFNQGTPAVHSALVPALITSLVGSINLEERENWPDFADEFTKEFLDIHPFADGNGRVGSLLWNYLRGTINDPEPMPYFYGEDNG